MKAKEFRKKENWNKADFFKGEYDIDLNSIDEYAEEYANAKVKAKLEEAAERATLWCESPINGTEFKDLEYNIAEDGKEPFWEKVTVFKQSITETPLD